MTLRERRGTFAVRAALARALDGERAPAHHVADRGAGLRERPAYRVDREIVLARPVARRLHLARGGHRGAAADIDLIAHRDRSRVPARLLTHVLGVDVAPRARRAEHGLRLDLHEQL